MNEPHFLIVAGSRHVDDRKFIYMYLDAILASNRIEAIVSGCASGPDTIAIEWAKERNIDVIEFPITQDDWERLGNNAGPSRNTAMARVGTAMVAFWDGKSTGTKDMIKKMKAKVGEDFVRVVIMPLTEVPNSDIMKKKSENTTLDF